MAVPIKFIKLEDVRLELLLAPPVSLSECIVSAGKTGLWNKLSDFAAYDNTPYLSATPTSLSYSASVSYKSIIISSNVSWSISDNATWIIPEISGGSGDGVVSCLCQKNTSTSSRSATITISWSGTNVSITVYQEGEVGDPCVPM